MRNVIICLALLAIDVTSFAQQASADYEAFLSNSVADLMFLEDYESALPIATELDSLKPSNAEYLFKLGVCTYHAGDKPFSLSYFLKAYNLGYKEPSLLLFISKAYRFNFDLENAIYYIDRYITVDSANAVGKAEAIELKSQIQSSREILDKKLSVDIKNLGTHVNSEAADYVPITLGNDSLLIFTSRRENTTGKRLANDGHHYEDIYVSSRSADGEWNSPIPFPEFNGKHHDANVAINHAGTELYIFKSARKGDIYKSKKLSNGKWQKPKKLRGINSSHWEGSVCLSPAEDTLYFSSDRPGGFGGSDIYFATCVKGKWTNVTNLGDSINTEADEDAPYLYKDGKTFFFSSKGHHSIGGYDVFSAKLRQGKWSDIRNVGFPINSIADDIYFQLNSTASIGYFTSFRYSNFKEKSVGEKDLFEIRRPFSSPVYFVFKGRVTDGLSREPIPAVIKITNIQDSTSSTHRLVTDVTSGKFRSDLMFDNRYRISVQVNGKEYFSKELFYPYQPDLFETFLDIPLREIPVFKMKLNDVIADEPDSSANTVLDDRHLETIVLVRKISFDDPELKKLLLSRRIPVTFRKRLFEQLKKKSFVDEPDEGKLSEDILEEMKKDLPTEPVAPVSFDRLEYDDKTIESAKTWNKGGTSEDYAQDYSGLSNEEKQIVDRVVNNIVKKDTQHVAFDELYYLNLTVSEKKELAKIVAVRVDEALKNDTTDGQTRDDVFEHLFSFLQNSDSVLVGNDELKVYDRDSWGILHTIESARMKQGAFETIRFSARVVHRSTGEAAESLDLLLADDRGNVYSRTSTKAQGSFEFSDLRSDRRYHILVNDYAIALLNQSRYKVVFSTTEAVQDDGLVFYNKLSIEQKRAIDRLIAADMSDKMQQDDPDAKVRAKAQFEKLPETERRIISSIRKYLQASSKNEESFFLDKKTFYEYDQMNVDRKNDVNILVAASVTPTKEDSIFYQQLSLSEQEFVKKIGDRRRASAKIVDDVLMSERDTDYWYIVDEISIDAQHEKVDITANVLYRKKGIISQVALIDENREISHATSTDSSGQFQAINVIPGKKYQVIISIGTDISDLANYTLANLRVEETDQNFVEHLSASDRKMIDRIIAIRMAAKDYSSDPSLTEKDREKYGTLSTQERNFIDRIRAHLFPDSLTGDYMEISRDDNRRYYFELDPEERVFINRMVIKSHYNNHLKEERVELRNSDKQHYEHLPENARLFVDRLERKRRAEKDILAEEPVLIAGDAWALLDSVDVTSREPVSEFSGKVISTKDARGTANVVLMVTDQSNNILKIISTDSVGHFAMKELGVQSKLKLLTRVKRNVLKGQLPYAISDLKIEFHERDVPNDTAKIFVFFGFDQATPLADVTNSVEKFIQANLLTEGHQLIILIGHADRVGTSQYNQALSQRRNAAVRNWLIQKGVTETDIKELAYGESRPIFFGKNEGLNRRVEILVIK